MKNTKNESATQETKQFEIQLSGYLEALRHALELADGIDEIFNKHMTNRTGKYIVFCANFEHMQEMIDKAPFWFAKVDQSPRIYSVYSRDPSASQSFQNFKEDTDSNHLRLIYYIDALNEGIHLDDISGVILLRPTVSPIIFKQQIGRALSTSKKTDSVIFDIVLNIENLYSIGLVEEEMQIATAYYRSLGENEKIINEHFKVIDEIRDCVALFEKLNDTLTTSWEIMFEHARSYFLENGDLEIPVRYITEDSYSIGHWIYNQRNIRKRLQEGNLTEERIAKLDAIGMRWDFHTDVSWEGNFAAAETYFRSHGNLDVPSNYITKDGLRLGAWICRLRKLRDGKCRALLLSEQQIAQLDKIGMIWKPRIDHKWQTSF